MIRKTRNKLLVIVLSALLAVTFGLAGCSETADTGGETSVDATEQAASEETASDEAASDEGAEATQSSETGDKVPIEEQLYITVGCANNLEYMNDHKLGMKVACEELGVTYEYTGPSDADPNAFITAFEQAIAKNPQGIVLVPTDTETAVPTVAKAVAAGINVVTTDADLPDSEVAAFVGTGNYGVGETGGEYLAKVLGEKGKVAVLYMPQSGSLEDRRQGFDDTIKKYKDMEIVGYGDTQVDYQTAANAAASLLSANPDLDAFICFDAAGGSGAATAVQEAGREGEVKIVAMDKDGEILQSIKDGKITATIAQNTPLMQYYAMQILFSLYNETDKLGYTDAMGITPCPKNIDTGCYIIDADNVDGFLQ
jgi:ribose transport system substrate-binding protein